MILLLYGQPGSGKTTIAKAFMALPYNNILKGHIGFYHIDGDLLREATGNKGYDRASRMANCRRANDIALYALHMGYLPVMSVVHPYIEPREELRMTGKAYIVMLDRLDDNYADGKEKYKVSDFEYEQNDLYIRTDIRSISNTTNLIYLRYIEARNRQA